jgi:microcompartment protein CcmK/EutM
MNSLAQIFREGEAMLLGKVAGSIWATQKDEKLEGVKFLIVNEQTPEGNDTGKYVVAIDTVQAGIGDVVLVAAGSSARQTELTKDKPVDAVIMAVVDKVSLK